MPALKRAEPLVRAKPLDDWSDPDMSGVWRKLADSQAVRVLAGEANAAYPDEPKEASAPAAPAGERGIFGIIIFVVLALMAIAAVAVSMWLDLDTQVLRYPAGGATRSSATATQPEAPPKTKSPMIHLLQQTPVQLRLWFIEHGCPAIERDRCGSGCSSGGPRLRPNDRPARDAPPAIGRRVPNLDRRGRPAPQSGRRG